MRSSQHGETDARTKSTVGVRRPVSVAPTYDGRVDRYGQSLEALRAGDSAEARRPPDTLLASARVE
jgi:hypothetical protein